MCDTYLISCYKYIKQSHFKVLYFGSDLAGMSCNIVATFLCYIQDVLKQLLVLFSFLLTNRKKMFKFCVTAGSLVKFGSFAEA
jgi:hypothetical protein